MKNNTNNQVTEKFLRLEKIKDLVTDRLALFENYQMCANFNINEPNNKHIAELENTMTEDIIINKNFSGLYNDLLKSINNNKQLEILRKIKEDEERQSKPS